MTGEIDVCTYAIERISRKAKRDPDKDGELVFGDGQNQRLWRCHASRTVPPAVVFANDLGCNVLGFP